MKCHLLTCLMALLHFFCVAQDDVLTKKITITVSKAPLSDILSSITEQSKVRFSYANSVDLTQTKNISESNISLKDALNIIFTNTNISWELIVNQIVLTPTKKIPLKIYGTIADSASKQVIQYATVYLKSSSFNTYSDFNGKYTLSGIPEGTYTLAINSFGYKLYEQIIELKEQSVNMNIELSQHAILLSETIVSSDKIIERSSVSQMEILPMQIESGKGLANDPLNGLSALPGILGKTDLFGTQDLHIRGGEAFENQFLLDNIKLPFPFYFIGQSVFNPEMLQKAEVLTGGYSPNYGNSMSSIFNLTTKNGNSESYKGNVDLSVLNSSALMQGPIIKNKLSFIIGLRKNNFDLLTINSKINAFFLADATSKITYTLNEKSKLSITTLNVIDALDFTNSPNFLFGLKAKDKINAQNLQLQTIIGKSAYSKTSFLHSGINVIAKIDSLHYNLNNNNYGLRQDFTFYSKLENKLKTGFELNLETEKSNIQEYYNATDIRKIDSTILLQKRKLNSSNLSSAMYIFYDGIILKRILLNTGFRLDFNQLNQSFIMSPRTTLGYELTNKTLLSISWGIFNQSPTLYQLTKNKEIKANQCQHTIISLKQKIDNNLNARVEAYYKNYNNLVIFDSTFTFSNSGYGIAKGIELFIIKDKGQLNGWLSYALAQSDKKRNLQDKLYPYYFDQRHSFNLILNYALKRRPKWSIIPHSYSIDFRYATGTPYTPINGVDSIAGKYQLLTGDINSKRNSNYNNLNVKIQWQRVFGKQSKHLWQFYINFWNLFSQSNIVSRVYNIDRTTKTVDTKYNYALKFVPNIGFKVNFNYLNN